MRTKDFQAALEAGFERAYQSNAGFMTVPYVHDKETGEVRECLGMLLNRTEHCAVVVAHAAHWILEDPDLVFNHQADPNNDDPVALDVLEDFANLVAGMKTAPFMQWTCVYFPGLTEEQVLGATEAGHDPDLIRDGDHMHPIEIPKES